MLPFLHLILLLSTPLSSSKFINSNNVSLTTELIPHIEENKTLKTHSRDEHNFKREPKDGYYVTNEAQPTNSKTFPLKSIAGTNDVQSQTFPVYSKYGKPCMVCPLKRKPSLKKALAHSYQALKLVLLPTKLCERETLLLVSVSVLASAFTLSVLSASVSEEALQALRKEWALQGEVEGVSVEDYLKVGVAILVTDVFFRCVVLRLALLGNVFTSNFLQKVNWLGTSLEDVERGLVYKGLTAFSQGVSLLRIAAMTYVQYLMMEGNWNSASFLVDDKLSKKLSKLTFAAFLFSLFRHVMDSAFEGNLSGFLDIEHFLEPMLYREKENRRAVYEELCNVYKNLPEFLRNLLSRRSRYFLNVYNFSKSMKFYNLTSMDWIALLLHISMALYSNSGAGVYLAFLEYLGFGLVSGMEEFGERLIGVHHKLTL